MKDYIEQAIKTESIHWFEPNHRLLHAAMGLVTESSELRGYTDEKNMVEELGDVMWYVALGCDTLEVTLQEAEEAAGGWDVDEFDPIDDIISSAGEIVDVLKKSTFYGKPFDARKIVEHLGRIILAVAEAGDQYGEVFLDEIMATNILKLQKRFSKGAFTKDEALNRNVDNEMSHF